jgi:hypothetical protein
MHTRKHQGMCVCVYIYIYIHTYTPAYAQMNAMGVSCTDVELASMFIEADRDGDGTIDFAEFDRLMQSFYTQTKDPGNMWMQVCVCVSVRKCMCIV